MERLCADGAKHIFMVTGRGVLFLSDAVAANKELNGISLHHEQSAAYAAVAYAQYTWKPGACLVSTGCASTNAITGVLNAWQDGIPCVFISGQNKLKETTRYTGIPIRTFGQQEADIISIVQPITKYAVMITDSNQIVYEMENYQNDWDGTHYKSGNDLKEGVYFYVVSPNSPKYEYTEHKKEEVRRSISGYVHLIR